MVVGAAPPPPLPGDGIVLDDARAGRLQVYAAGPSSRPQIAPALLVHSVNAAASAHEVRPIFEHLAATRPTYALDLPGFGRSDRSPRRYVPRLMTDAIHAVVAYVRERHGGAAIDGLAVSLSCEFLARAAVEAPPSFRTLALVSPTGLTGRRLDGPAEATLGRDGVQAWLAKPWLGPRMFGWLTRPGVVRYFLRRTYGRREIDERLWSDSVATAHQPGAEHAPLYFLSGHLFSRDATRLYEQLTGPVWISHGVRGDFVRYDGVDPLLRREGVQRTIFETGALPYFEQTDRFMATYERFLEAAPASTGRPDRTT